MSEQKNASHVGGKRQSGTREKLETETEGERNMVREA